MAEITTGKWWEPSWSARQLPGVLFNDGERGWLLRLDGSFEEVARAAVEGTNTPVVVPLTVPDDYPVLLGLTSQGKLVTLFGCSVVSSTLTGWPTPWMEISPTIIAYDVHFTSPDAFRLTSLSVRYSNMDAWAGCLGL